MASKGLTMAWASPAKASFDTDALFRAHRAFLARSIRRLIGQSDHHADDLLQETFIIAHQKRAHFDPDRADPRAWLYGIAANLCRRHLRSQSRRHLFQHRFAAERSDRAASPPSEAYEQKERAQVVFAAMAKLSVKQREVFALYELEGMEGPAIAKLLDLPVNTVWTRLHHGRKKFRSALSRQLKEDGP